MRTLYDRLKVAPDAPAEVIRAAYRALSQRHHPDRNPGDARAARTMQSLNEAYAVLSDPARRQAYDASLGRARPASAGAAGSADRRAAPPPTRAPVAAAAARPPAWHRRAWAAAAVAALALAAGAALWGSHDPAPKTAPPVASAADAPEWTIHGLDPPDRVQARAQVAAAATRARRVVPPAFADALPAPVPVATPSSARTATAPPSTLVVADPNGRPWPFEAGYVAGLPQGHADGLATVTVDNRGGASAVFVKLVSLDAQPALAVRHVYVPAMGRFTIGSMRPGRYALHYQDLFTGRTERSPPFELRRFDGPAGMRYSAIDVALHPVPGGALQAEPPSAADF